MKIKIEIPKILCNRTTREISKDEIYYAILLVAGKVENNEFVPSSSTPLFGKVSEVQTKVSRGLSWRPKMNNFQIDIGDAQYFALTLSLYERDNGKLYDELKKGYSEVEKPENFAWKETMDLTVQHLAKEVGTGDKADVTDLWAAINTKGAITLAIVGGLLFEIAKRIFKHLRQDDLLGVKTVNFDPTSHDFSFPREFNFLKFRGKYDVSLQVSILDD